MDKVNIKAAFDAIDEHWEPRIAGELNGQAVKLAKADGEFIWHHHDDADELFLITDGKLRMEFRDDEDILLREGEFLIVPRGTEHRPVAEPEAHILLFEPMETLNTGNVENERTQAELKQIR
jgi:mannose-6-phosphate isomerase-like protein (cupin superfamily)